MQNLTSDYKKFKCSCQKKFILPQQLATHLKTPSIHLIKLLKTKPKKQKYHKKALQRYKFIKSFDFHSDFDFLIKNLIHFYFKNFSKILLAKQTYFKLSLQINQILKKPIIKEITIFKHQKQQIKTNFNHFLQNKFGEPSILHLSEDILMSGGLDGIVRLFNPQNLEQIASLNYQRAPIFALDIFGNYGLSGSQDQSICLWNINKHKLKTVFKGHQHSVHSLKFFNNSRRFVSGSADTTVRIWDSFKKLLLFLINFNSPVRFVSMTNKEFIFVCFDGKIQNLKTSKSVCRTNLRPKVFCSKLAEEIDVLVTGHRDGMIQFLNSKSLHLFDRLRAHTSCVNSIAFCKHSKIFVSCSEDGSLKLWSSYTFKLLKIFEDFEYIVRCVEIFKNEIYSGSFKIEKWNIDTRRKMNKTSLSSYYCFSISIKLNLIVYGFDAVFLKSLKSLKNVKLKSFNCKVGSLCFVKSIIVCGLQRGDILYLDCLSLRVKRRYLFERWPIYFVIPSNDLNVLVYSCSNKTSFVDLKSKKSLLSHNNRIMSGKFTLSSFVFIDTCLSFYIVKDFEICKRINFISYGCQLYLFKCENYVMIKEFTSNVILINLEKAEKFERLKSLKEVAKKVNKKDYLMKKSNLILSSLTAPF